MTVEEIITRYGHNAEYERTHGNLQGCLEFRQLVDWLKDYKRQKEAWKRVKEEIQNLYEYQHEAIPYIDKGEVLEIIDVHLKEVSE